MAVSNEKLTGAFNAGKAAARAGKSVSSGLIVKKGKLRDFWEHGFSSESKIIEQEEIAYRKTPEYREEVQRDAQKWATFNAAMAAIKTGNYEIARVILNKELGMGI